MSAIFGLLVVCAIFMYFVPAIVGALRSHPHEETLFMYNLAFGWTIVGWFACLIWALIRGKNPD